MSAAPLFTDASSRESFFANLESNRAADIRRGSTFATFAALNVGLWYDIEPLAEDAARILVYELAEFGNVSLDPAILARSSVLRKELRDAIAPGIAKAENSLATLTKGRQIKSPTYAVPSGKALDTVYRAILADYLVLARLDHHAKAAQLSELRDQLEDLDVDTEEPS